MNDQEQIGAGQRSSFFSESGARPPITNSMPYSWRALAPVFVFPLILQSSLASFSVFFFVAEQNKKGQTYLSLLW